MDETRKERIRKAVRETYGKIGAGKGCGCSSSDSKKLGYSDEELSSVPEGADLGLGCGNPQAIASLRPGETAVDLGSGGGFDCFLASRRVGGTGRVIGVDMTPEMISRARANAARAKTTNVEFRLGKIEHLPVADGTADVVISNCVVNLSPDKKAVYREAFRVLKQGGRLAITDIVAIGEFSEELRGEPNASAECITGAMSVPELEKTLRGAGFEEIRIKTNPKSREVIRKWKPGTGLENSIASATIEAWRKN